LLLFKALQSHRVSRCMLTATVEGVLTTNILFICVTLGYIPYLLSHNIETIDVLTAFVS
jgi:hypothetical protein